MSDKFTEIKNGTVKFYNKEKGYGFIFYEPTENDVYFHINDWKNGSVPCGDDDVRFEIQAQSNGREKAINIKLVRSSYDKRKEEFAKNDDRIICHNCSKKIIPRLVTHYGKPTHSLCPYCASTIEKFGSCFIATAIYKDYNHPQVMVLRTFRDSCLLTNKTGSLFVKYYYKYSPSIASHIKEKSLLSFFIRKILDLLIFVLKKHSNAEANTRTIYQDNLNDVDDRRAMNQEQSNASILRPKTGNFTASGQEFRGRFRKER